ncbi:MAG: AAA family ATPase, partial [Methylococcales bacterium]|nr:AAA family ATPase [Methylococcales bacterium]
HAIQFIGEPTLVVESGGTTTDGKTKLHAYWKLSEPVDQSDLESLLKLRAQLAQKIGGDTHFKSAHQPIRIAGSIHHKHGAREVTIRQHIENEYHLLDLDESVSGMPNINGIATPDQPEFLDFNTAVDKLANVNTALTTKVREGGQDDITRFESMSIAMGHYIRLAHSGHITASECWDSIVGHNQMKLDPPWQIERVKLEADRLWEKHIEKNGPATIEVSDEPLAAYTLRHFLDDKSPMPQDFIAPRVLTPGSLLVLGGAPKVGKSEFLVHLLAHCAAGVPFLNFTPARPMRVFYLQSEIQYPYLKERLQQLTLPASVINVAANNLLVTPRVNVLLNENGVDKIVNTIKQHFPDEPPDIICIDPIRNVFDPELGSENDNSAMMRFLRERVDQIQQRVNPECGIILAHHTRKIGKKELSDDPFQALSGAGSLRGYYSSGLLLYKPDENRSERVLACELRNGPSPEMVMLDKDNGQWVEVDPDQDRIVNQEWGEKLDAERRRKGGVILQLIHDEALKGNLYTANQFAEKFEGKAGLSGKDSIRDRISVYGTKGYIKYIQNTEDYNYIKSRSPHGYMCVEDMVFALKRDVNATGKPQDSIQIKAVPSHFKCPQTGAILQVENPDIWFYPEEELA